MPKSPPRTGRNSPSRSRSESLDESPLVQEVEAAGIGENKESESKLCEGAEGTAGPKNIKDPNVKVEEGNSNDAVDDLKNSDKHNSKRSPAKNKESQKVDSEKDGSSGEKNANHAAPKSPKESKSKRKKKGAAVNAESKSSTPDTLDFVIDTTGGGGDDEEQPKRKRQKKKKKKKQPKPISLDGKIVGKKEKSKNELTHLIPGYTAPMKLNASSLDKFRTSTSTGDVMSELRRKAEMTDSSTRGFVFDGSQKSSGAKMTYSQTVSSFKHGQKKPPDSSAGAGWFHMAPTPMSDGLRTDLAILKNRAYLDPKRFYKRTDLSGDSKMVQVGTVIEGAAEFHSSRLSKAQRRSTFADELMADGRDSGYVIGKFKSMQREREAKSKQRNKRKRK